MRILVTAGPTREYLDPIRFLSNASSGRMGFAVAREARRRGHRVTLVTGPVQLDPPDGVRTFRVESARDMHRRVLREFARADALVMAAAVCDFAPRRRARGKIPKDRAPGRIEFVRTPDILAALGRRKGRRILVGFALETGSHVSRARRKLRSKNLDLIVANGPRTLGSDRIRAVLVRANGAATPLGTTSKDRLARRLVREIEWEFSKRSSSGSSRA